MGGGGGEPGEVGLMGLNGPKGQKKQVFNQVFFWTKGYRLYFIQNEFKEWKKCTPARQPIGRIEILILELKR